MMTSLVGALLIVVAIQTVAIVALLVQRARRTRAARVLRHSEERFRLVADHAPVMIWTARPDTTLDFLNRTCIEFTGMPLERLVDEGWLNSVHPDDVDGCTRTYTPAVEARVPFLMEYRLRRADGAYRWVLDSGVPRYGPDGAFAGYIGSCIDITERRDAEERTRESRAALERSHREVQHLAGRLIEAQDTERARIARDLHDDVSQQLAGLSIAFSGLKQQLAELDIGDGLLEDLRGLQQRTTAVAHNVRHLSHDLHPTVLRHAGLVAALNTYCAELERAHGTVLRCTADGDFASIAPEAALCVYRIAQEALRNVIAHAGALRADVRLHRAGDVVEITVTDDGKGFDVASSLGRGKGLGLVSITERVRIAGGTISIVADGNTGTRVCARIPAIAVVTVDPGSDVTSAGREYSV